MKEILVAFALLSASALAQNAQPTPPSYCRPCLFYGGDFDASNPAANTLSNGLVNIGRPTAVYVPFVVPKGQVWTVTGLFSNNMSTSTFLDPPAIKWSISIDVSAGHAGTVISQGTIPATFTPTGRSWRFFTEYTALGHLTPQTAVTLTSGVYWMTAIPICTDPSCGFASFTLSDVEDVPAPNHKGIEPKDDSFFLAEGVRQDFFAPTAYPNGVCNGGGNGTGCDKFSAGLLGYAKAAAP
ncbi:MAG: hypothetical protein JWQ87_3244 [Candidatus Sulfotelmatobacter sp.]|nr:hypothetical protein [Candidatus Sulfotelmatobacter sp.]